MKHTLFALAFAVATLTGCSSTKQAPVVVDGKGVVATESCASKKDCSSKKACSAKKKACTKGSCATKAACKKS